MNDQEMREAFEHATGIAVAFKKWYASHRTHDCWSAWKEATRQAEDHTPDATKMMASAEPVAWMNPETGNILINRMPFQENIFTVPLYAAPTPGAEPKPNQTVFEVSQFVRDGIAERQRQIDEEGFTSEHDEEHDSGELASAAACYAFSSAGFGRPDVIPEMWPWARKPWKPTTVRRDLVKAMALLIAEGERLDRLAAKKGGAA